MIHIHIDTLPLIAILRGIEPEEAVPVGEALFLAGFRCLEVPLNSPCALDSIGRLADRFGDEMLVGAGTVLSVEAVDQVCGAGGRIIISPNTNPEVIERAKAQGLISLPGVFTPTEAFIALASGADGLKLFPAEIAGPSGLRALKAVLPAGTAVYAVGGVDAGSMAGWRDAGADGFGLGSALFRPGRPVEQIGSLAQSFVAAWRSRTGQ